jgi:hypothetical protein
MKKILLSLLITSTSFVGAQVLQSDNFNSLNVGNIGTDFTGLTAGQGDWLTFASNGTAPTTTTNAGNANFQIVSSGNTSTKGLLIQGPNGNGGGRFMWKDGLPDAWAARTTGNNIIETEVDFFTGAVTTSTGFTGVYLYNLPAFDVLNGFIYTNSTRLLRGIARLTSAGVIDTYLITLATGGLFLNENTWYRLGFGYNTVTGEPTWRINTFTSTSSLPNANWVSATLTPDEIDLVSEASSNNALSYSGVFDNFIVKASATDSLLGTDQFVSHTNAFSVYPNPATNFVNVSSYDYTVNKVDILDMNGRIVKSVSDNSNEVQINLSDLAQGVYMMTITSNEGISSTKKIVKQ